MKRGMLTPVGGGVAVGGMMSLMGVVDAGIILPQSANCCRSDVSRVICTGSDSSSEKLSFSAINATPPTL